MKVKISSIVESQIPSFLREESPLLVEFIRQYFVSGEYAGGPFDLISNIDSYTKLESLTKNIQSTVLSTGISFSDTEINVTSTKGFPDSYGLLKIDSEIITYTNKTDTTFNNCVRGFCGTSNYELEFSTSESASHSANSVVENLSVIFLNRFLEKLKKQLIPGFEGREFTDTLNQTTFIEKSKDFYATKGTDRAFEILFGALYGEPVSVIKPRDYLFTPSDAEYRVSKDLVVESIFGDPLLLENRTLFQDETENYSKATGAISKVEKIYRGEKTYYVISLDYDFNRNNSHFGEFSIHPKTQLTSFAPVGAKTLDVDSTVGFPKSGSLLLSDNSILTYTSKSINQFFGCSGVTFNLNSGDTVAVNAFAYGYVDQNATNTVSVRVTGVIGEFKEIDEAYHLNVDDIIRPKSLGKSSTDIRSKNWFYNIPNCYNLESVQLLDSLTSQYEIKTIDNNFLNVGDAIKIYYKNGTVISTTIYSKVNFTTFVVQGQGQLVFSNIDYIENQVARANSSNFADVSNYSANIQNVYVDSTENYYVASPSLPVYFQEPLAASAREISLNGSFSGTVINYTNHGFISGDVVVYDYSSSNLGIAKGIYYIKKVTKDSLSLATSRTNLKAGNFVSIFGTVTNNTLSYNDFSGKTLNHQKLLRKISQSVSATEPAQTPIGNTGILNNGVEILNYKSQDAVFYGPIDSIVVISPGSDYDVINPPVIEITDETGINARANCEVIGKLKEIRIVNPGLNYTSEPSITISGGNGKNAKARAEISLFEHSSSFDSTSIVNNTIGFSTFHGFNNAEKVLFKPDGKSKVSGITTDSQYFTYTVDSLQLKLHKTYSDAISGINTITLTPSGIAIHRIVSADAKTRVSSVNVINYGTGYVNHKVSIDSSGISTETNIINKVGHGFKSGELIVYQDYTNIPISGITTTESYYVTPLNENSFKLSEVAATTPDYNFKTGQFVTLTDSGSGTHYFNYEPIVVTIDGISGVGTNTGSYFSAEIQPIFRGEITSVSIENGGQKYGQEDILNYNRQPSIKINSGESAQVQPIIIDGKITQVLVINSGSGYNAPPIISVSGTGTGVKLTPIVKNGELKEVKIINSGYGYDSRNTYLNVISSGTDAQLRANMKRWTINNIERLIQTNKIVDDDGIITKSINSEYGLQYVHGYAPRKLRKILSASKYVSGNLTYQPDLQLVNNKEKISDSHSPILGWAYDGNPIYGPYGYEAQNGGKIKIVESSYKIALSSYRPNLTLYPQGFFVEDYQFTNTGDLDEHNGRYCVTPEFPNGTYAYFATVSKNGYETTGAFANYFKPVFPYFIGNTYHSKIIDFNFSYASNQDIIDLNDTGWLRNITPFAFNSENSFYKYLIQPFNQYEQSSTVTSTLPGSIERVIVSSGGVNYKIADKLVFNSDISGGINATAEVASISGKPVSSISIASTSFYDVEFTPSSEFGIIGYCKIPHSIEDKDNVSISNLFHNKSYLQNSFNASVIPQVYTLNTSIGDPTATGNITYINLYGNFNFPYVRENDIFQINSEKVRVLNVDKKSSRLRVEREYGGSVGTTHDVGTPIKEIPRKFFIPSGKQNFTNSTFNREIYFNPSESVGIGYGNTIVFSNPGIGPTSVYVPTKSIYIPEHGLTTGDKLIYKSNGGSSFSVTNGITTTTLNDNTSVYVVSFSGDFVGLSTQKVGIGSTGNFVGYNTTSAAKILYYNTSGSGYKHSLITTYDSTIGQVNKNLVSVFTDYFSELSAGDSVTVSVLPSDSQVIKVAYNKETQRLLLNPRTFTTSDVFGNFITLKNHGYYNGKKIIHTSSNPTMGLENNGIYYAIVINSDKIGLSNSYYGSVVGNEIVELTGTSAGAFSEINPSINVLNSNSIIFDLSDSSLSDFNGFERISSFNFDIFTDKQFFNKFYTTYSDSNFNVIKAGKIGIDSTANVTIRYDNNLPNELYYNLIPNSDKIVYNDKENITNFNKIIFVESTYSGEHIVSGIGSTSFNYTLASIPEQSIYINNIKYTTNSNSASGPIDRIVVTSGGSGYKTLPGIGSVISDNGSNAIFEVFSKSIGRINNVNINDIGYDYPADLTLTPITQTPIVLKVVPQTTLKSVVISAPGKNYNTAPFLVLLDGLTLKRVTDVDLRYTLGDSIVTIFKNSKGINNVQPIIIPTNNSNAIGINSITFNNITKDVTLFLAQSYSNPLDFPFIVGDKVLIENVSIYTDPTAKGYNSSSYDYSRFEIKQISPNIGGANGTITYNLSDKLNYGEYPGIFNTAVSSGSVIPEKFFPQFTIELTKNSFLRDEIVTSGNLIGKVQFWNEQNELLTLSTADEFSSGIVVLGTDSLSQGTVDKVYEFKSEYEIKSSSIVKKGWNTEKGFFDNEFQRIQDSNYYQAFAYSLKSKIDYETWNNPVSSLTHTAGFKKFADFILESEVSSSIDTDQNIGLSDANLFIISEVDLNAIDDYDLGTENNYKIGSNIASNQIYFTNRILQNYSQAVGNRVLVIDDISSNFDGIARQFNLTSSNKNIFLRNFDGSSQSVVDVNNNIIKIPNHYFTNGEKVSYSYTGSPIGIQTTNISGIGLTNKLPSTLYVIKYSETDIGFADTAENAIKGKPVPLTLSSVGTGSTHILKSTIQNTKAIISLGGIIQAPIVATATSTRTTSYVGIGSTTISFMSVGDFSSGDYAKIDDEIVKVISVGVASTNSVSVNRGWVGTGIATHAINSSVYKIQGDYNIVDNTIHFVEPPKGPSPTGTDCCFSGNSQGSTSGVGTEGIITITYTTDQATWLGIPDYDTNTRPLQLNRRGFALSTGVIPNTRNFIYQYLSGNYAPAGNLIPVGQTGRTGSLGPNEQRFDYYFEAATSIITGPPQINQWVNNLDLSFGSFYLDGSLDFCGPANAVGILSASSVGQAQYIDESNSGINWAGNQNSLTSNIYNIVFGASGRTGTLQYTAFSNINNGNIGQGDRTENSGGTITITVNPSNMNITSPGVVNQPVEDFIGITTTLNFNGRVFMRNGIKNTINDAYYTNFVFDDISSGFNGISSTFTLKNNSQNITGIATNTGAILINEVFQEPSELTGFNRAYNSYTISQTAGISSIRFLGAPATQSNDVNGSGLPVGGVIVSIGYTQGFGLQPLVSAGGTANVSLAGTITSISVNNSGSGYRVGLQTVNVKVYSPTSGLSTFQNVGVASVLNGRVVSVNLTNPGAGFTFTNPPTVKFDSPLPYANIPLLSSGIGTGAKINLTVGIASSVIDVEMIQRGFGYRKGDVLTLATGGTVGIPTVLSPSYSEFKILVDEIYNNKFSGWTFGELQLIDSIESLFDGIRRSFPIKIDNELRSIRTTYGSLIDINTTLLIFVNGILQNPGESYSVTGSSFITFTEPPKETCSCTILFYRGSGTTDVIDVDVLETIKPGDLVRLDDDFGYAETDRLVSSVTSSDSVNTITYTGAGISEDVSYVRPVRWRKQTEDLFINQAEVTKNRVIYEEIIEPTTKIIKNVGINTTVLFVENVKTIFDDERENTIQNYRNELRIITQDDVRVAIATVTVSNSGSINSVTINDGGKGYVTPPAISFPIPVGLTTASRAYATATVTTGSISSIVINTPGVGYTFTSPPQVMIESPKNNFQDVTASKYEGDFGLISGIGKTSVGIASTALVFDLYIPEDSFLRNSNIVGSAITISGIQTGYYFVVKNSYIGSGNKSLDENGNLISNSTTYIDNVYRVAAVSIASTYVSGIGTTSIVKVITSVDNNNVSGIGVTNFYGTYSWGRITIPNGISSGQFSIYNNGISGINTSPAVKRINPLKYKNYT